LYDYLADSSFRGRWLRWRLQLKGSNAPIALLLQTLLRLRAPLRFCVRKDSWRLRLGSFLLKLLHLSLQTSFLLLKPFQQSFRPLLVS
jgi:hypothetical protein